MIRECREEDREILSAYLSEEPYGRAIMALVEKYGFDSSFQTVYVDMAVNGENERHVDGVYLWFYHSLILSCRQNQVAIDFLEQMFGIVTPDIITGRKDNVNIVSWLLTDYLSETAEEMPLIPGDGGKTEQLEEDGGRFRGEWHVLRKEGAV